MAVYDWPDSMAFYPSQADMWLEGTDVTERSALGGGQQTSGRPGAHWQVSLSFPDDTTEQRQELLGFLRMLNGKEHRLRLWDLRKFGVGNVHGHPAGTIDPDNVTVKTTVAQFGTSVVLTGCGAGATLKAGDMFGINGQLIENCLTTAADGAGNMTVLVPQRLRAAALAGTPVTLVKPTALFVLGDVFHGPRGPTLYEPFMVEFEEVFS